MSSQQFPQPPYSYPPQPPPKQSGFSFGFKFVIGGCIGLIVLSVAILGACGVIGTAILEGAKNANRSAPGLLTPTPAVPSAPATGSTPPLGGKWVVKESTSEMDSSAGYAVGLQAENEIEGWLKKTTPVLFVRCQEKKVDLFINVGMPADVELYGAHTVRVRLDEAQPLKQNWGQSTDNEALFSRDAIPLAKKIAQAQTLRFEFTPFNGSPQVVTFDVRGFSEHLEKVLSTCKKK